MSSYLWIYMHSWTDSRAMARRERLPVRSEVWLTFSWISGGCFSKRQVNLPLSVGSDTSRKWIVWAYVRKRQSSERSVKNRHIYKLWRTVASPKYRLWVRPENHSTTLPLNVSDAVTAIAYLLTVRRVSASLLQRVMDRCLPVYFTEVHKRGL